MRAEALAALACPVCREGLSEAPGALRCARGHSFDIARQGYVNLLVAAAPSAGDTADMVAARQGFLARGHFAPIAHALAEETAAGCATKAPTPGTEAAQRTAPCVLAEVGAGTAYYLAAALGAVPDAAGIALDVSKQASRRAAKAHPDAVAVVANAWDRLPLRDASIDVLLDVFAPRNAPEFARVLRPAGSLVVVTPNAEHLAELVSALGLLHVDPSKDKRVAGALEPTFERRSERRVRSMLELAHADVAALSSMGPSAHHVTAEELTRRVAALPEPVPVTLDVTVSTWRKPV